MKIADLKNTTNGTVEIIPFFRNQIEKYRSSVPNKRPTKEIPISEIEKANKLIDLMAVINHKKCLSLLSEDDYYKGFSAKYETAPNTISPKIAVLCETVEQVNNFLLLLETKNRAPASYYFGKFAENTCFSLSNGFAFGSKKHYENIGFEVVSFSEIN